jgi:hypothetical protein
MAGSNAVAKIGWDDKDVISGVKRDQTLINKLSRDVGSGFHQVGSLMKGALGGLGVGLGVGTITSIVDQFDRLGDLAGQLRVSAEAVQKIGAMAKLSASDVESVVKALNRVNKALAEGTGRDVFQKLKIDVDAYLAMQPEQQILTLASAFQEAERNGHGLAEAYDLFGKSAAELLPLLRSNVGELEKMADITVVSDEQIQQIQKFNDMLDELTRTAMSGAAIIGTSLATEIGALMEGLREWTEGGDFGEGVDDYLSRKGMEGPDMSPKGKGQVGDSAQQGKQRADDLKKEGDLRDRLAEEKARTDEISKANEQKLTEEKERQLDLLDQQMMHMQSGDEAALLEVEIKLEQSKRRILEIQEDITREAEKTCEAAEREADIADRERERQDEARAAREESISALDHEMSILQMKARGQDRAAEAAERERDIREEAARIMKDTGMSEMQALAIAREKANLEKQIAGRGERKGKIHGYSQKQESFGASRIPFRGEFEKLQQGNFWDRNQQTPNLDRAWGARQGADPMKPAPNIDRAWGARQGADPMKGRIREAQPGPTMTTIEKILSQMLEVHRDTNKNLTAY